MDEALRELPQGSGFCHRIDERDALREIKFGKKHAAPHTQVKQEAVQESSEPAAEKPKPTAEALKSTNTPPKPTAEELKPAITPPKPTAEKLQVKQEPAIALPKPTDALLKPAIAPPKPTDALPKPTDALLKPAIAPPKPTDALPKPTDALLKPAIAPTKPTDALPKPAAKMLKVKQEVVEEHPMAVKRQKTAPTPSIAIAAAIETVPLPRPDTKALYDGKDKREAVPAKVMSVEHVNALKQIVLLLKQLCKIQNRAKWLEDTLLVERERGIKTATEHGLEIRMLLEQRDEARAGQ
jgi:hypothetical protein